MEFYSINEALKRDEIANGVLSQTEDILKRENAHLHHLALVSSIEKNVEGHFKHFLRALFRGPEGNRARMAAGQYIERSANRYPKKYQRRCRFVQSRSTERSAGGVQLEGRAWQILLATSKVAF